MYHRYTEANLSFINSHQVMWMHEMKSVVSGCTKTKWNIKTLFIHVGNHCILTHQSLVQTTMEDIMIITEKSQDIKVYWFDLFCGCDRSAFHHVLYRSLSDQISCNRAKVKYWIKTDHYLLIVGYTHIVLFCCLYCFIPSWGTIISVFIVPSMVAWVALGNRITTTAAFVK